MKKLCLVLALFLLLGLIGCGGQEASPTTAPETAAPTQPRVAVQEGMTFESLQDVGRYTCVEGEHKALTGLPDYVYPAGQKAGYKSIKNGRFGQTSHIFTNATTAAYITYLQALEGAGWEQYSCNVIEGVNLFATYTRDGQSVYAYHIPSKERTYILHSPFQNLEAREQDNQYEKLCQPLMTQVKLLCESWPGGMSYVIRLSDGRFIIIDGGYNERKYHEAQQLYKLLEEQNVRDKITVAAWIITHPHKDHLGAASDFLRYYNPSQVDIQQMILNFPTDDELLAVQAEFVNDTSDPSQMPTFLMALETLWPEVPITVCHTGQRYYFADGAIEILHTYEDFYPQSLILQTQDPVNGASVVFSLELGGQKTMFLADSAVDCSADLVDMWGDYLKSDIMQASHHGLNGGSVPLYAAIDPEVVMVPMVASFTEKILSFSHSRWIWNNESGNIREVILSDWAQRTLELPYSPGEATPYFSPLTDDPWAGLASKYQTNP